MPAKKRSITRSAERDTPGSPPGGSSGLAKAWDKLKNLAVDLTTIDVTTFQGTVTVELSSDGKFNPSQFYEKLQAEIKDSKVTLVAHTHVDFDLDSVVIVNPDADPKLTEAHNKAVQTAVDARQAVVRLVAEMLKLS